MELVFRGFEIAFDDEDISTIEDARDTIYMHYHEELGSLQHSCIGTSERQRLEIEAAISILENDYASAMQKLGYDE